MLPALGLWVRILPRVRHRLCGCSREGRPSRAEFCSFHPHFMGDQRPEAFERTLRALLWRLAVGTLAQ